MSIVLQEVIETNAKDSNIKNKKNKKKEMYCFDSRRVYVYPSDLLRYNTSMERTERYSIKGKDERDPSYIHHVICYTLYYYIVENISSCLICDIILTHHWLYKSR